MRLFIPSKTFLIGEYSVLKGGTAFVVATTPCFEFIPDGAQDVIGSFVPHPASPAGKALARLSKDRGFQNSCGTFRDPHRDRGGFGASTAEWLAVQLTLSDERDVWKLWELYRSDAVVNGAWPSGADLLGQILGGVTRATPSARLVESVSAWPFRDLGFLIFRTGFKLKTHDHLKHVGILSKNSLAKNCEEFAAAMQARDADGIVRSVREFSAELLKLDLVDSRVIPLLEQLAPLASAVKGCGAMGADTILCVVTPAQKLSVMEVAPQIGLEFVADQSAISTGVLG